MAQDNLDLGVIQETKFTGGIYTLKSAGYRVVDMEALSRHYGRVTLFYHAYLRFSVEVLQRLRPNVVSF